MPRASQWRGARGEWYVVVQFALFALVAFGPRTCPGWPPFPDGLGANAAGISLLAAGFLLMLAGILRLGSKITPLPLPVAGAELHTGGPYRLVRHPMYAGAILMAFGWALLARGWLTVGSAVALFVFFDLKTRREERWLCERFPDYPAYRKRVRKLIPFIY